MVETVVIMASIIAWLPVIIPIIVGIIATPIGIKVLKDYILGFPIIVEIVKKRGGNASLTSFDRAKLLELKSGLAKYKLKKAKKTIVVNMEGEQLSITPAGKSVLRLYSPGPHDYRILRVVRGQRFVNEKNEDGTDKTDPKTKKIIKRMIPDLQPINERAKASAFASMKEEVLKYNTQTWLEKYMNYVILILVVFSVMIGFYLLSGNMVELSAENTRTAQAVAGTVEHLSEISDSLAQILGQAKITISTTTIPY